MNTIKFDFELINALKIMWDYLNLNMPLQKADLIIGCGCRNLKIPQRCAELYSKDYGKNILFCGGYGKLTGDFIKPVREGVTPRSIIAALIYPQSSFRVGI